MTDRPIHVVHVLGRLVVGGIQKRVLTLIRALPSFSHAVISNSGEKGALYAEYAAVARTILCPYPRRGTLGYLRRMRNLLRDLSPDVVVAHLFGNHALVSWAAFLAGVPATFGVSANDPVWFNRSRRRAMALAYAGRPFCRGEIAVSHAIGRILTSELGLPAARVHVITNGCRIDDIAVAAAQAREQLPPCVGRLPRLLMVGAMMRSKNHPTLFQAIGQLHRQGRPVELWLAGDGNKRSEREAMAARLGLRDQVKFLGDRDDVPQLLGAVDALVHSTNSEGLPNVLIEAMAAGTPVIATDIPPCREVLDEGHCGLLVPHGDAEALSRAILRVLDDESLRRGLVAAAKDRVRRHYDVGHMAAGYAALFSSCRPAT